tara:strand:- start:382 stop:759 length:378 start_codon:yes stop_codon:yes gene_type:complete
MTSKQPIDVILDEIKEGGMVYNDQWVVYYDIPCQIIAAYMASKLAWIYHSSWLINTKLHSVAWDGNNTWDLGYGRLFNNYKFPDPDPPTPKILWQCNIKPRFYEDPHLKQARDSDIMYTKMFRYQ